MEISSEEGTVREIKGYGEYSFEFVPQGTGDYRYDIKITGCNRDGVKVDSSVYTILVSVFQGEDGVLSSCISATKSKQKVTDICFECNSGETALTSTQTETAVVVHTPDTGDNSGKITVILLFSSLISVIFSRKNLSKL